MTLALTIYGRSHCHLCQNMLDDLDSLHLEAGFSFEYIEIDGAPALENRFGLKVPVLMAEEREICHYVLDIQALKEFLANQGTAD